MAQVLIASLYQQKHLKNRSQKWLLDIIIISCHRFSSFPGNSPLEPVVNPTSQALSFSL
jgi:hypothetical protein